MFGFNNMSTLVGHLCHLPEKGRRDSRGDEREGQGRKRKMNESVLFELRFYFYCPVNPMGSCRVQSVYQTTLLPGRLSPQNG